MVHSVHIHSHVVTWQEYTRAHVKTKIIPKRIDLLCCFGLLDDDDDDDDVQWFNVHLKAD